MAIGRGRSNIMRACQVEGVVSVNLNEHNKGTFIIKATTEEALKKAQDIIQISQAHFFVPNTLIGEFLSDRMASVEEAKAKSGLLKLKMENVAQIQIDGKELTVTPFLMVGTTDAVELAHSLLTMRLQFAEVRKPFTTNVVIS